MSAPRLNSMPNIVYRVFSSENFLSLRDLFQSAVVYFSGDFAGAGAFVGGFDTGFVGSGFAVGTEMSFIEPVQRIGVFLTNNMFLIL